MLATSGRRRYALTWFVLGLLLGGLLTATALAVVGAPVQSALAPAWRWALVGVFAVGLGLRTVGVLGFPLPENRRLVPQTVLLSTPPWSVLQFGIEMGSGVRTFLTSSLPYLLALAVACVASPVQAWAAGAGFGAGRALMAWGSGHGQDPSTWRAAWAGATRLTAAVLGVSVVVSLTVLGVVDVR